MSEILTSLGVDVQRNGEVVQLRADRMTGAAPPYELVNGLRASFFAIGPLLARMGFARVPLPGGCQIGARPVVEHIRGLKALGAVVNVEHGIISASIPGSQHRLKGASIVCGMQTEDVGPQDFPTGFVEQQLHHAITFQFSECFGIGFEIAPYRA